jgi:hypothetical protein
MSKAILKFDLSDPDDQHQFNRVTNADNMAFALFEITRNLKKSLEWEIESKMTNSKNNNVEFTPFDALDLVYDAIFEKLNESNINIDNLIN